jgi:uncharacterized protein
VSNKKSRLRFNFGFLLEADISTSRIIELDYPSVEAEDVLLTPLRGAFEASRNSKGIYLTGELESNIQAECTRCLEPVLQPVTLRLDDLFYYPPHTAPPGEPVVGDDGFLDLAPLLRQLSLLEIPMQVHCRPECKGLCPECGASLNEGPCQCEKDDFDPRLAGLRQLLDT